MHNNRKITFIAFSICALLIACTGPDTKSWTRFVNNTGTYSSPRTVDLNKDGVPDIIIGAGGKEEKHSDTAVLAIDGITGKILWSIPGENQYVGSAVFIDITNDGTSDVIIGGRWAQLVAIDGINGKIVWSFFGERQKTDGSDGGWYNFTTPQFVPDQDGDHINDILIANGGDARAKAFDTSRPAGRLLVLSSKTGQIMANAIVPDKRETYMSVVADKNGFVYFGTGGETIGGHLYRTTLVDIMKGDISKSIVIASSERKGFVASPVLVDITNDETKDIVINTAEGKMLAINGKDNSIIWQLEWPGTEAYTISAVGRFTNDSVPDFFANFAIGTFPTLTRSIRFMVDGQNGKLLYSDTVPAFQYASAVTVDLNDDGYDEVIVAQSALRKRQFDNYFYSSLVAFDVKNNKQLFLIDSLPATNLASTPWIGDLDADNNLDIIYTAVKYEDAKFDLEMPIGLYLRRFSTSIPISRSPRWGAFMGSGYTGIYK